MMMYTAKTMTARPRTPANRPTMRGTFEWVSEVRVSTLASCSAWLEDKGVGEGRADVTERRVEGVDVGVGSDGVADNEFSSTIVPGNDPPT
jgi:hypothetical protein